MPRLATVLLALWAGSLWTVCGMVAPLLFATLDERRLAGSLAAQFFHIEAWLGVAIGVVLLVIGAVRRRWSADRVSLLLVVLTALAPLLSELAIGPLMGRARAVGDMARFGLLHGVASALFVAACFSALALLWRFSRPAE